MLERWRLKKSRWFLPLPLTILRSWYSIAIQMGPLNPVKYEKNGEKILRNPPPRGRAPKILKKYTWKNTKTAQKSPFLYFFCIFFVFIGARPGVGDFVIFSYFFRISGSWGGFELYTQERGITSRGAVKIWGAVQLQRIARFWCSLRSGHAGSKTARFLHHTWGGQNNAQPSEVFGAFPSIFPGCPRDKICLPWALKGGMAKSFRNPLSLKTENFRGSASKRNPSLE